jgi:hypothetical protein
MVYITGIPAECPKKIFTSTIETAVTNANTNFSAEKAVVVQRVIITQPSWNKSNNFER